MKRRISNHLFTELLEQRSYAKDLSEEDRKWLQQFMFEYYQADFNYENNIHPKELRKDCMNRNNASRRQLHSVGQDKIEKAARKARTYQDVKGTRHPNTYYTPEDYSKNLEEEINEDFE